MVVVRVSLAIVVDHFIEIFAGDVELVGNVVVAASENDFAGAIASFFGANGEVAVRAIEVEDALVLVNICLLYTSDAADE